MQGTPDLPDTLVGFMHQVALPHPTSSVVRLFAGVHAATTGRLRTAHCCSGAAHSGSTSRLAGRPPLPSRASARHEAQEDVQNNGSSFILDCPAKEHMA